MVSVYPQAQIPDANTVHMMEHLKEVIGKTRDLRNKNNLKPRDVLPLYVLRSENTQGLLTDPGFVDLLKKSAWLGELIAVNDTTEINDDVNLLSFVVDADKYYLASPKVIDVKEEIRTLREDLEYQRGFVQSISKKLDNENFVKNAPEAVVEKERQKMLDGLRRMEMIRESLSRLSDN